MLNFVMSKLSVFMDKKYPSLFYLFYYYFLKLEPDPSIWHVNRRVRRIQFYPKVHKTDGSEPWELSTSTVYLFVAEKIKNKKLGHTTTQEKSKSTLIDPTG